MKKILFILPFIIMAIAFSGCKPVQNTTNTTGTGGAAYIGGTQGLSISFLINSPPSTVLDKPTDGSSSPFDISLRIENKGEYDVAAGKCKITMSGIDPASFGTNFNPIPTTEQLGKTRKSGGETIPGTFTILTLSPQPAYKYQVSGQLGPFNLRATACYEYQTEATSNICILKDLLGTTATKGLCNPNEVKTVQNSGAPVGIQNLEQSVTGKSTTAFTFVIKHVGDSKDMIFLNEGQSCTTTSQSKINKVKVNVKLGDTPLTQCTGIDSSGIATLYGDTGAQIRCIVNTAPPMTQGDYVQPIKITLLYDYMQYIDQPLTVKQTGT